MKIIAFSSLIGGLLLATVAGADPVAVEDGAVFIAGNNELSVELATSAPLPAGCPASTRIQNATDVAIANGYAFVTANNGGVVDVTRVDVSACLLSSNTCDISPTANLTAGQLDIPCLEVNGKIYDIRMRQRGNSMNWEVTGIEDSHHSFRNR